MKRNCFRIDEHFYEQKEGTAIGNKFSPFLANSFQSTLETKNKKKYNFCLGYGDVFAV